jgi:hypothetical protein
MIPRTRALIPLVGAAFLVALPPLLAAGDAPSSAPAENRYVGAKTCKGCHSKTETGDQFGAWQKALHSHAFEVLGTPEAKEAGAARGVSDPQTDDRCVKCHVTAFGVAEAEIKKGFDPKLGVQCETCHGPGELHFKARMKAMAGGDTGKYPDISADEIVGSPTMDVCKHCHNEESPSYKPFCFHEFSAKIAHRNPKKPRAENSIGVCSCEKCQSDAGCSIEGCKQAK